MAERPQIRRGGTRLGGFTLLEILIVLVLVGVVTSLAVGGVVKIQARSQARAAIEDMFTSLHLARSDAVARQRNSGVAIALDTTNRFTSGGVAVTGLKYLRFVDSDVGVPGVYDPTDTVIQGWTRMQGQVFAYSIASSGLSAGTVSLVFNTDGSINNDLQMKLGIANFSDTFTVGLLPATGLATLDRN
jgi:type IV fimbrial biogenesis protein FimT